MGLLNLLKCKLFINTYFSKDGEPKQCIECGCKQFNEKVIGVVSGHVSHSTFHCASCGLYANEMGCGVFNPQVLERPSWRYIFSTAWRNITSKVKV